MHNQSFWSVAALALSLTCATPASGKEYGEPLEATLRIVPAAESSAQEVELQLTLKIKSPWHIFADTPGAAGQRPLELDMQLPEGVEAKGTWIWPKYQSVFEGNEIHIYTGEQTFKRRLKIKSSPAAFNVNVTYQACNPEYCAPVQTAQLRSTWPDKTSTGAAAPSASVQQTNNPSAGSLPFDIGQPITGTPLDLKFAALDGRPVDIAQLQNKVVLIDLWAMWCTPCVAELPNVKAVYEKYRQQGLEVIGINFDGATSRQKLEAFVRERGLGWPQRFDGQGFKTGDQQRFRIRGIPATFLIDKQGRLVGKDLKGAALEPAVRQYLGL